MQHLLHNPAEDGGQWHMLVNLVEKYGVVPKACFADSWSAQNSRWMNSIINNKVLLYNVICKSLQENSFNFQMREFCLKLRAQVKLNKPDSEIQDSIENMMEQVCIVSLLSLKLF